MAGWKEIKEVKMNLKYKILKNLSILSFFLAVSVIFYFYFPLLLPIFNSKLEFIYGDFSNIISRNSSIIRNNDIFYSFDEHRGVPNGDLARAALVEGAISCLGTDSQRHAILILIVILLGSYGIYRVINLFEKDRISAFLLMLIIILFYFLNLWSVERIGHLWIWITYAIFPLFLSIGFSYIYEKKIFYLILYALLFSFFGIIPHSFLYLQILHLFLALFLIFTQKEVRMFVIFLLMPLGIYFILNSFFLFSYFSHNKALNYPVSITLDELIMLSINGELSKLFTFSNNWWPQVPPENIFGNLIFRISSLSIFVCTFFVSVFSLSKMKGSNKFLTLLSLFFSLLIIFIAQGTNNSLLFKLLQLLEENHLLEITAPFREWERICILLPILLSLVLVVSISSIKGRQKYIFLKLLLLIILLNIFTSPSMIYLYEVYSPVYVPEEYYNLSEKISTTYKTLWIYPTDAESILGTWRYKWNTNKAVSEILEYSIGSTYPNEFDLIRLMNEKEAPQNVLDALNIKYIVMRTDILGATGFNVNYTWLNCTKLEYLTFCERTSRGSFSIYGDAISSDDDAEKFYSIAFLSQIPVTSRESNRFHFELFNDVLSEMFRQLLNDNDGGLILKPYSFTYRYDPNYFWSRASSSDLLHTEWHPYLKNLGIENWQSDYGMGLVFTWAQTQLTSEEINPSEDDIFYRYNFEDSINFTNLSPQFLNCSLSEKAKEGRYSLQVKVSKGNTLGWKVISTDYLPIKPDTWYQFRIWISGKDVNSVHSKVIFYNDTEGEIKADFIFGGQSGTFDWTEFIVNFLSPKDAKYIKIQFWVLQNNQTDSYYWVDDVRVYQLTKYTRPNDLKMNFQVNENGTYHLLIRYFKNQKGGSIKVILDDKEISLNSKDQLNKFVWKDLGEFYLERGVHTIILRNIQGFNAVNLLAIIPSQKFLKLQKEMKEYLENKIIIYILEGESDMYNEYASIKENSQASNGRVLNILPNGKAWQEIEIVKNGYYMFAFRLEGSFEIKIDNSTFLIDSDDLHFTYIGPIYLEEGKHQIEVSPKVMITNVTIHGYTQNYLDVIWVYSVNSSLSNKKLEDLFYMTEIPAKVKKYSKINPTLWKVEVNATKPFVLSFAESYDPLWEARVYKDGKLVENVKSIPLYGVINGFCINTTGDNLEIIIRYTPQDWFEIGLVISRITFVTSLFYLFYDWRKSEKDKWALALAKKFQTIIGRIKNAKEEI
jgi:hypothetical protein